MQEQATVTKLTPKKVKLNKTQIKRNETLKKQLKDKKAYLSISGLSEKTKLLKDCDLRLGHHMLAAIAKVKGHDLEQLKPGFSVGFLNHAQSRVKIFYNKSTFVYHINPTGGKLRKDAVKESSDRIARGEKANWDKSLANALENELRKRNKLAEKEDLKHI